MAEKFINQEVAIKLLERHGLSNGGALGHHSGICDLAAEVLRSIPAADVAPVRRGRWEIKKDLRRGTALCNQCNYAYSMGTPFHEYPPKYCPNCGAKMDGNP